jgi:hypothetical protein
MYFVMPSATDTTTLQSSSLQDHSGDPDYSGVDLFNSAGPTSSGPQSYLTATGGKLFKRTRGPALQPLFAWAKNDPIKKSLKQERTHRIVEWLMTELQNRTGCADFCDTFNQIKHNPGAVRSWTFTVEFMEDYYKICLVVSAILPTWLYHLTLFTEWLLQEDQEG